MYKFAWREDPANEFYAHPVLMIVGLSFFAGEGHVYLNIILILTGVLINS